MRGERVLVNQIRAVMEPANPVPGSASQAEPPPLIAAADLIAAARSAEPAGYEFPGPDPTGRDSSGRARPDRTGRAGASWRVLAPVLSGLAVVVVAVALSVVGGSAAKQPVTGPGNVGALPRFYVTINIPGEHFAVIVHDSVTGRATKVAGLPGYGAVVAARSDREYFLAVYQEVRHDIYADVLYRLRLSQNGRTYQLTKEPGVLPQPPLGDLVDGIALSPDGSKLAVILQTPHAGRLNLTGEIDVIQTGSQRARAVRTWTAPKDNALGWDPVWLGDSELAFLWQDHLRGTIFDYTGRTQVRLLDTTAPGGSLLSSRVLASGGRLGFIEEAYASPSRGPIIAATDRNVPALGVPGTATVRLVALSPVTGRLLHTYAIKVIRYHNRAGLNDAGYFYQVLGFDRTGRNTLVVAPHFGALHDGVFTRLPAGAGKVFGAAW